MPENQSNCMRRSADADFVRSVSIPPRPALLMALQHEMKKGMPHLKKVGELVSRDAAMAGNLLEAANSAFYRPGRRIKTVPEAVALIGMDQFSAIMTGLITKRVLSVGGMMMARFWDVSEKRANGLSFIAKETQAAPAELAYSFGLFCDIGIPLMKVRFSTYVETLSVANLVAAERFLKVENVRHGANHAHIGALLAEKWGIASEVIHAIRAHHTPDILYDESVPATVRGLIASNFLVEKAIQEYRGESESLEWLEAGAVAAEALDLSASEVKDLCDRLILLFFGTIH